MFSILFFLIYVANTGETEETPAIVVDCTDITISTVSPLPSPLPSLHDSVDPLTLEIEVQDLINRVTVLEEGQEHILKIQRSILKNQDAILSRLAGLENRERRPQTAPAPAPIFSYPQEEISYGDVSAGEDSFDSVNESGHLQPPAYILPPPAHHLPPPPRHHPPPVHQPTSQLPAHAPAVHNSYQSHCSSPAQSPTHPHHLPAPSHPPPQISNVHQSAQRIPFQQIYPFNIGQGVQRSGTKLTKGALASSVIKKTKLAEPKRVIEYHPKLMCPSKVPTLAVKLAKESFFGEDVMAMCTVSGNRELPALPTKELQQLKHTLFMLFPQYWRSPHEFEPVWKSCTDSVGQACKRARGHSKTSQ